MASLQHQINGNYQHICGATIVNEKFVLTAAHCVFEKNLSDLKLVFGTDRLNFLTSSSSERNIAQITIHPSYDNNYFYNDTAILELDLELNFDLTTSAICLPKSFNKNPNSRQHHSATITGWGAIQNNGFTKYVWLSWTIRTSWRRPSWTKFEKKSWKMKNYVSCQIGFSINLKKNQQFLQKRRLI